MASDRSRGDSLAMIVVLLVAVSAFNNFRRGTLASWLSAKLTNAGDIATGGLTVASIFGGTGGSTTTPTIATAPGTGGDTPAGLVNVAGTQMSARFAAKFVPMAAAAAADGITLTGRAWRSNAQQKKLREDHGCGGANMFNPAAHCTVPTAVPGHSRHETGDAIDLDNARSYSSPAVVWLKANAHKWGIKNLPGEPWHWSIDGH